MPLVSAAALLLVALLGSPTIANAQPASAHFDLTLDAPAGCPSTAEIVAAVDSLVHTARTEPLHVSAQIVHESGHFTLNASWESGQRRLQGDSCEGVSRALIAIVALAIDPSVELSSVAFPEAGAEASSPTEPAHPTQPASGPERSEPLPARPRATLEATSETSESTAHEPGAIGSRLTLGASLSALGEWGSLPTASYGVTGVVRGTLEPWSAELGGSWLSPQWAQVPGNAAKGGDISWRTLLANACRAIRGPVSGCAGVELGELHGQGKNVAENDSGTSLWLAAALTALARWPLGAGVSAELRAVAAFPVFHPDFTIQGYPPLHQPHWASGRLSLGIAFR